MGNILSLFSGRSTGNVFSVIEQICGPTINNPTSRKRTSSSSEIVSDIEAKRFKLNTLHYVYQKVFYNFNILF